MADPTDQDLRITPAGHAAWDGLPSTTAVLLHLVGKALREDLPPGAHCVREFARRYVTALCHRTGLADPIEPPASEDLAFAAMQVPPVVGAENLSAAVLETWWRDLDAFVRRTVEAEGQTVEQFLASLHPSWHAVGRVTFHLAENKRNPDVPFAFLATYTSGIGKNGAPLHVPLLKARQEYAGNRDALLKLLAPLNQAQKVSRWVAQLVESQDIYRPLAWTPEQAYAFLRSVPVLETAGIVVRVPDWWSARKPPRPKVSVTIGKKPKRGLGVDAMLDFDVAVTLGDQPLTDDELHQLLQADEHLVQLRGQWVELDREKLKQALAHWRQVEKYAEDGVHFIHGMRLLSGLKGEDGDEQPDPVVTKEWAGVQAGPWLGETLAHLREPEAIDPPADLRATLRPYQRKGFAWLRFMTELGLGACLADDMGLGKTVQVIALLLHRASARGAAATDETGGTAAGVPEASGDASLSDVRHASPVGATLASPSQPSPKRASLLVVPASLIPNWKAELAKFAPSLKPFVAHASETNVASKSLAQQFDRHDVVITTYAMLTRLAAIREHHWDLVVLDEAQAIKNAGAKQAKATKEVHAAGRIALSGTPIENRLSDLWSLFDFLNPGLLGSAKSFSSYVKRVSEAEDGEGYASLRRLVQPYILRRMKTDKSIISDLPDKIEMKTFCTLSKAQAAMYQQAVEQLGREMEMAEEGIQKQGLVLAYLMKFKQICNHPAQFVGEAAYDPADSGKFARLGEICGELASRQQRALIFTQFREMTDPLADYLATVFGRPGLVLHGATAVTARKDLVDQFQREDGPPFFVLSIKAGGTGLNLTAAANVIHFDRWWNPAVENQATDRAFRIGQKQNVLVHKFVCQGTIEERIDALIEEKIGLSNELLGTAGAEKLLTDMKPDELLRFVSLDLKRATGE
jgi:non-specific serine/threonine protein kinase